MKFKKGDRVEYIGSNNSAFTKGKIYTVREDGFSKYGNLTIELDDKGSKTNGYLPKYFKLIEENKMRTDKKVMAEVLRKAADNLDNGLDTGHGIEYQDGDYWSKHEGLEFYDTSLYRIKPETITLKNGVVIPKPLAMEAIDNFSNYYFPCCLDIMWESATSKYIKNYKPKYIYKTMAEAIEASKALFGIE